MTNSTVTILIVIALQSSSNHV